MHPRFRWLLVIVLVTWPLVASQMVLWTHWGILGEIGALFTGASRGSSQRSQSYGMDLYLRPDGGIDAISKPFSELPPIQPTNSNGLLIASYAFESPWPTDFGVVIQPVTLYTEHNSLIWHDRSVVSNADDLLHLAKTSERIEGEWPNYLPKSTIYGSYRPPDVLWIDKLSGVNQYLTVHTPLLLTELAYYAVFGWWLLTLIYARKLWPKHYGSHCPTCKYPTLNLPTTTCPECGTALPSPREP